jgi:hypothetical protein
LQNGIAAAFQAVVTGSIPVARSLPDSVSSIQPAHSGP